jgi:seryl-tRNA synthetase
LALIRSRPEVVREALRRRREDEALVDEVLAVDARRRALVDERDTLRAEQNQASKGIGRSGKPSEADLQRLREMRERIRQEVVKAVAVPEARNRFLERGIVLKASGSLEEFGAFLRKQVTDFAKLAKEAGIQAN